MIVLTAAFGPKADMPQWSWAAARLRKEKALAVDFP
jgi:hypothetical protein